MSEEMQEFIEDVAEDSGDPVDEAEQYDDESGDAESEEEEEDEIDVGDKKLRVPKSVAETLKSERLMHADYTRKTQEVADQRKAFETQQAQHQEQVKSHQAHLKEVAAIVSIDDTIEQYKKVDWEALSDADPIEAQKHYMKYQRLTQARAEAVQRLQEAEDTRGLEAQQTRAKQIEETQAVLMRDIKGWSPEVATKLHDYAIKSLGFTPQEMGQVTDARIVKLIHKAYVGEALTNKPVAKQPQAAIKPATVIKGNAPVRTKNPAEMTDTEFNAFMRKQLKN